jgi:hypothetical protein
MSVADQLSCRVCSLGVRAFAGRSSGMDRHAPSVLTPKERTEKRQGSQAPEKN